MRMTRDEIVWSSVSHETGRLILLATHQGLCYVGSPDAPLEEAEAWTAKYVPEAKLRHSEEVLRPYAGQLLEYLNGKCTSFELSLELRGTPFQLTVWRALQTLAYGQTSVYADMASAIGKPGAARAVGAAIGANPLLIVIPCHRVIGKNGALTGYRGGLAMKTRLLALEKQQQPVP